MIQGVYHRHLDVVVHSAEDDNYPDSGLNLVRLPNEQWILAVDFGDDFTGIAGLLHSSDTAMVDIKIYPDERTALEAAFTLLAAIHDIKIELLRAAYKKQYGNDEICCVSNLS